MSNTRRAVQVPRNIPLRGGKRAYSASRGCLVHCKRFGLVLILGIPYSKGEKMEVTTGVYAYLWRDPYDNNCNTYVIRGEKTILVDPGHSRHVRKLFLLMEEDAISSEDIDLVIATHSHPDHSEGMEAFDKTGSKITMSRNEERYLLGNGKGLFEMMGDSPPGVRFDFYLREGELRLGPHMRFDVYETPGHSPGSLSIYWPEQKVLITGDVIFYGGIGRTDFPEGDSALLVDSIEKLSRLDTEFLLPGHGEIIKGKEKVVLNYALIRESFFPSL
jgi:hydroxyacylglutathione hydrolase